MWEAVDRLRVRRWQRSRACRWHRPFLRPHAGQDDERLDAPRRRHGPHLGQDRPPALPGRQHHQLALRGNDLARKLLRPGDLQRPVSRRRAGRSQAQSQPPPRRRRDGAADSLHLTDLASLSQARQVDRGTPALALSEGHLHRRFLRGSWGPVRRGSRPRPLPASRRSGKASWSIGNGAISRPSVMSTSGPTASTSHHGSTMTSNACACSSVPTGWAARNCWRSPTATGRAPSPGAKCCSISSAAAWLLRPSWPPATGRSVSGKPCARSTGRRASSAVGCTRPPTCSTKLPKSVQPRAKQHLQDIWMAEIRAVAEKAFDFFLEAHGPRTTKRWPAWPRTATCCSPSTTSRPSAGSTFAPHQSHRKNLCDRAPQDPQDQGLPQPHDGAHHGLQAVPVGRQEVAPPGWLAPDRRHHSRRQIQGRRKANRTRRLKPASPTFDNSSQPKRLTSLSGASGSRSSPRSTGHCTVRRTRGRRSAAPRCCGRCGHG